VVDAEQVRAAVTLALDATMGTLVDEIARRVLAALNAGKPQTHAAKWRRRVPRGPRCLSPRTRRRVGRCAG